MNATTTRPAAPGRQAQAAGDAEPTEDERAAAAAVLKMIWGIHISRAVYVAAELGIADRLASGPASAAELAAATQTHERSLYRVLRLLASLGVLTEREPRTFGLTQLGDRLRTDVPASMRSWARLVEAVGGVRAFEPILQTVRTGEPGVDAAYGMGLFEFLERHPAHAASFDAAMSERTSAFAPGVAAAWDFARARTVADIGGGHGTLLSAILRAHSHLRGILMEAPAVAAGAGPVLQAAGVADRCEVVTGDFFAGVPAGADCYLLANVLHDWDDDRAAAILARCRETLPPGGQVLIIERLIPDDPERALPALLSDINMLVVTGGMERTTTEYGELLAAAGLRPGRVMPVAAPYGVIEGLPA
jgi:O-methyltransferase domain/Dimerisation domain